MGINEAAGTEVCSVCGQLKKVGLACNFLHPEMPAHEIHVGDLEDVAVELEFVGKRAACGVTENGDFAELRLHPSGSALIEPELREAILETLRLVKRGPDALARELRDVRRALKEERAFCLEVVASVSEDNDIEAIVRRWVALTDRHDKRIGDAP